MQGRLIINSENYTSLPDAIVFLQAWLLWIVGDGGVGPRL